MDGFGSTFLYEETAEIYGPREIRFFLFLFAAIIKDRRIFLSMAWTFRECVGEVDSWRRVEMIGG